MARYKYISPSWIALLYLTLIRLHIHSVTLWKAIFQRPFPLEAWWWDTNWTWICRGSSDLTQGDTVGLSQCFAICNLMQSCSIMYLKWCSADQECDADDSGFTCCYFALCQHPDGKFHFKFRADSLLAIGVTVWASLPLGFLIPLKTNANMERNKTASCCFLVSNSEWFVAVRQTSR